VGTGAALADALTVRVLDAPAAGAEGVGPGVVARGQAEQDGQGASQQAPKGGAAR
jgi:hypothetical protein